MQAQDACGQLEIDNALVMVRDLEKDIQEAKASAREGKLKPLPGETVKRVRSYRPPNPQIWFSPPSMDRTSEAVV